MEVATGPVGQRSNTVGANILVGAVVFRRTGHTQAIFAQAAGHNLGFFVQQADPRGGMLGFGRIQVHRDRIAFDGVDIDVVTQHMGQMTAAYAGAHHQGIDRQRMGVGFSAFTGAQLDTVWRAAINTQNFRILQELHAALGASIGQAASVFVNIARGVRRRKETAVVSALQGRFDLVDFFVGNGTAFQTAFLQQLADFLARFKAAGGVVDVQNAALFQVEINVFVLGPLVQILAGGNGQLDGVHGVALVTGNRAYKLRHPAVFVPAWLGIEQQWGVFAHHPFQTLENGAATVPDFGIASGQLSAVGEGGFHRGVAQAVDNGNLIAFQAEGVGGGDSGNTGANDGNMRHNRLLTGELPPSSGNTPSVL
ncbi:hypothetical protein ALFP_1632 [Alcaligenes faecalis]|nr:hypothetical protein ALFP_1632 [Alcaligenes faecalis]